MPDQKVPERRKVRGVYAMKIVAGKVYHSNKDATLS